MKVKSLLEYCSWTALSILMFASGTEIAILAPFMVLASPAPFLIFTCRAGIKPALLGAITGTVVLLFAMGEVAAFVYVCEFAALGAAMGFLMLRAKSGADYFLSALAASIAAKLFLIWVFNYAAGYNPFILSPAAVESFVTSLSSVLSHGGVDVSSENLRSYAANMAAAVSMLMPSMIILLAACDTAAGYAAARIYSRRDSTFSAPKLPPFSTWRFPKNIFWALLAALILDMASKAMPDRRIYAMLSLNMIEVLRGVFLIEGLSLLWYFMSGYRVNSVLKYAVVCVCLFFSPVSYILSMVGVFDIWYDLRKRIKLRGKSK